MRFIYKTLFELVYTAVQVCTHIFFNKLNFKCFLESITETLQRMSYCWCVSKNTIKKVFCYKISLMY